MRQSESKVKLKSFLQFEKRREGNEGEEKEEENEGKMDGNKDGNENGY